MSKLIIILAFIAAVHAAGNSCKTRNVINRLVNNQAYYWPATWNESQTAPDLESGQSCSWTVTIPQGYYARLIINGEMKDKDSKIQLIDFEGNLERTRHETMEPYFYSHPRFTIAVSNDEPATFAFKIQWISIPQGPTQNIPIGTNGVIVSATDSVYNIMYAGTNGVSVLAFPESLESYHSLRSTFLFEVNNGQLGDFITSLYTLNQVYDGQYISSSSAVALVNLESSVNVDYVVLQDSDYVKDYKYVQLVTVSGFTYNATVHNKHGPAALISCTYLSQTMIDVDMDINDVVSIYNGTPNPATFQRNYTGSQLKSALPLFYPGGKTAIQWVLGSGSGKAVFTFQA